MKEQEKMKILEAIRNKDKSTVIKFVAENYIHAWPSEYKELAERCGFTISADSNNMICFVVMCPSLEILKALHIERNYQQGASFVKRCGCERIVFCYKSGAFVNTPETAVFDLK